MPDVRSLSVLPKAKRGGSNMSCNINERLILDYESVCVDIENVLSDIQKIRTEKLFGKLFGKKVIDQIKDYEIAIKKRLYDSFNLVVIGDFKRGKSTIINALLGENIVPSAVTPETVTINKLSYGDKEAIVAVLTNGRKVTLSAEEIKRAEIENLIRQLPAPIDYIDIKVNHELLSEVSIIDTPGIGDLLQRFDAQVADYLVNADAIMYIISARSPLSYSEQMFLSSCITEQSFARTLLVVNMSDTLETEQNIEKVRDLTIHRASAISDNLSVFMISALDELCRKQGKKRPEPKLEDLLQNNFSEFTLALEHDIIMQKEIIKSMRSITLSKKLIEDVLTRIKLVRTSLGTSIEKLAACEEEYINQNNDLFSMIEKHKKSLAADIDSMRCESRKWMSEFLDKVKEEINTTASIMEIADLERYFQFYMMDTIKNAVLECVQYHQKQITDKISVTAKIVAQEVTKSTFGQLDVQFAECIKDISWTSADSTLFVGGLFVDMTGLSMVIGPLYLVGQAIAGVVRQKKMKGKQAEFIEPILVEYPMIVLEILAKIDTIYKDISNSAIAKLDELYVEQMELSKDAILQARKVKLDESLKAEEVEEYLNDLQKSVVDISELLSKYD